MSLWVYKKDNTGKRHLWQIGFDPLIIIVVIGLVAALIWPHIFQTPWFILIIPLVLLTAGLALLIISKLSLYWKGIWFSFGPGLMSKGYVTTYKVAYVLIVMGVLLLLMLFSAMSKA
jgi:uncharacterized membrane protein YvlD (DUF360 family)